MSEKSKQTISEFIAERKAKGWDKPPETPEELERYRKDFPEVELPEEEATKELMAKLEDHLSLLKQTLKDK